MDLENVHSVLLIEPDFPIPNKSRNHSNFLPIGLLKIAAYLRTKSITTYLIRHSNQEKFEDHTDINPDLIMITSLFTYWSRYVKEAVQYYRKKYPDVKIIVGGIYASLLPEHCKSYTGCDMIIQGTIPEAEKVKPAYDLVDVDYQILHTSRGCVRKCGFCGTYKIEPEFKYKKSIKNEICKKRLIFYDNNLLANPYIKQILEELTVLKMDHKINYVESQSGFDGRILIKDPELAKMLKAAGFKNPKIAWDHSIREAEKIHDQIKILENAGYKKNNISIFMIYNYDLDYDEMEKKRLKCAEWGVQINDCRYRPLDQTFDEYKPRTSTPQTSKDYYIHPNWTDTMIRNYRRNIRKHNLCIRWRSEFYSYILEKKKISKEDQDFIFPMTYEEISQIIPDVWGLHEFHPRDEGVIKDYKNLELIKSNIKSFKGEIMNE